MSEDAGCAERFLCALFATVVKSISDLRLLISWFMRSALCALRSGLGAGRTLPPPSRYPRIEDRTLVAASAVGSRYPVSIRAKSEASRRLWFRKGERDHQ
jgi:hypothetical protein